MRAETKAEMGDTIARLHAENDALRALLAVVQETAEVPWPADAEAHGNEMLDAELTAASRIAGWLRPTGWETTATRIADRAGLFRAHLPLVTYAVKEA